MKPPAIVSITTYYDPPVGFHNEPAMWPVVEHWPRGVARTWPDELGGDVLIAKVNHNRWVAQCPYCPNTGLVDVKDPRFFCMHCMSVQNQCRFHPVAFPEPDLRQAIEEALLRRGLPYRNWAPPETVEDLVAENQEHGAT